MIFSLVEFCPCKHGKMTSFFCRKEITPSGVKFGDLLPDEVIIHACGLQGHYSRFAGYKKGFCCMEVNYDFVPEYESFERKKKSDILSYAGKLLEIVGSRTLVVGVDDDDKPFVLECRGRLTNALDFSCETY